MGIKRMIRAQHLGDAGEPGGLCCDFSHILPRNQHMNRRAHLDGGGQRLGCGIRQVTIGMVGNQ